jgi:hypothetical protein
VTQRVIHAARIGVGMERASVMWGVALVAVLAAGMLATLGGMLAVIGGRSCDVDFSSAECAALIPAWAPWEQTAQLLIGLLWVVPTGLGALLGVGVTAGEIERGTAQITWSLAGSRLRWLAIRAVPVAVVLGAVLLAAAGVAEVVARGRLMTDDVGFFDYQLRSLLVPARGLLAFAIGLAVGAFIGRTLPALILALAFSAAVTAGLLVAIDAWHIASAAVVGERLLDGGTYPLVVIGQGIAGPDGPSFLLIPTGEYWVWVAREGGLLLLVAAIATLVAIGIVQRRSP